MTDLQPLVASALEYARDAARDAMPTPEMAAVLETALSGFGQSGSDGPAAAPLAVYAAVRGEAHPAVPLAAAVGLFSVGLNIGDHVTDDERTPTGRAIARPTRYS